MLQDIKENHLSVGPDQINADHQEAQSEEELLQGLILQEWYQGDLQGYSADQIKQAITKELKQIGPQGHDAYDPVPLSQLSPEERRSIIESRWVIGPRPGSELKGRFCAKGFKQVISRDDKYASTPQATTLKLILLMSQIHSWEIAVSDIASAFSTPQWIPQSLRSMFKLLENFNIQSRPSGVSSVSFMDSEMHQNHGRLISHTS